MRVTIANLKGGTGKTTSALFLATAFAARGERTLLVDADPQGSALSWASSAEEYGEELPFPVAGLPVKDLHRKVLKLSSDYEHVVIDTPPGEIPIVRSALLASEEAVVTLAPGVMDIDRLRPTLELVAEVEPLNGLSYRVLLTRVRRVSREGADARRVMEELGVPVFTTETPLLSFYSQAFGAVITDTADYAAVAGELLSGEQTVVEEEDKT